ncbi:MAG: GerW family sporulation protein [Clostridia bacterium]|nr:GerW family sporulation protein [Clostridia bacterium]
MANHPIESLMDSAMSNLRDMIDVNTIVGEAIETINGTVIIPISKVSFGFAAGGSEFSGDVIDTSDHFPFGGGSGAGVNITPVGFVIVSGGEENKCPKFIPVDHCNAIDKLLDYVPNLIDKIGDICKEKNTYSYQFYDDDSCECEQNDNTGNTMENDTTVQKTEEQK